MPAAKRQSVTGNWQSTGFSLVELLVVISIIVIVLALALPAFNFITGSRSIDAALNQASAMISRARTEAVGNRQTIGVAHYIDRGTLRPALAIVSRIAPDSTTFDIVDDRDVVLMPPGVGLHGISDVDNVTNTSRYQSYGLILFSPSGQLISVDFVAGPRLINLAAPAPSGSWPAAGNTWRSGIGFMVYERDVFINSAAGQPTALASEVNTWMDNNALPVLVNRYNGTLNKAQ
jgi:prepilin-type N-terminal cleavage/methylation domain-containing protein